MKIALVLPHIFMQSAILPRVIFSPGQLALSLTQELDKLGHEVTIFTPGSVERELMIDLGTKQKLAAKVRQRISNQSADLSLFEKELKLRGDDYLDLLKKHPLTFISLARQVQSELIATCYQQANLGKFDLVHVWANEEEMALVNARFCQKPVCFTHHEPFNFLVKYRSIFLKYPQLNWISLSFSQRETFDQDVNWVGNVYHGLPPDLFHFEPKSEDYLLYMGRIIQPKGVHLAIKAALKAGKRLKIAGKHYAGHSKDGYWHDEIKPLIDGNQIEYLGFVKSIRKKQRLLGGAEALLMPSIWSEPFGLVMIEALACGTPVVGFDQGAIPEVVMSTEGVGSVVAYEAKDESVNIARLAQAVEGIDQLKRSDCRKYFERRFSARRMAEDYLDIYQSLA